MAVSPAQKTPSSDTDSQKQQESPIQTARQRLSTGQAWCWATAMCQEASSPRRLHTAFAQRSPPRRSHHPAQREPRHGRTKLPPLPRSQQVRRHWNCCAERLLHNRAGSESTHLCCGPERGFASQAGRLPACRGAGGQARMTTDSGKDRGNRNKQACGQRVLIATE